MNEDVGFAATGCDPIDLGLPHREPFVFVDTVTAHTPGEAARGLKSFPLTMPCFEGHFPGEPMVPGVFLIEAMAQIAGVAAHAPGRPPRRLLLAAVRSIKFHKAAGPGVVVEVSAVKTGENGGLLMFDTEACEDGHTLASGSLVLAEARL